MKSLFSLLLICSFFLFTHCDNSASAPATGSASTTLAKSATTDPDPFAEASSSSAIPVSTTELRSTKKGPSAFSADLEDAVDAEIQRQLALNPDLPELNSVAAAYDNVTVSLFTSIAEETGGQAYMIDNASFVVEAITDIIRSYMTAETDLVFLIDKTGSMSDDIDTIKKSVKTIIETLKPFNNARIGFAFYGDKYADSSRWFTKVDLNKDFNAGTKIINNIKTTGGGDTPESVNDGIAKTINEMNWEPGKRRVILLIGDAPSLEPPYADYSLEEVITLAKNQDVMMNFYPVVIGIQGSVKGIVKPRSISAEKEKIITTIAPNPATNYTLIKTGESDDYTVEIFDINGQLMWSKNFHDNNCAVMTDAYPTGVYIARILNNTDLSVDTKKFIVKK